MIKIQKILANIFLAIIAVFLLFAFSETIANIYLLRFADEDTFIHYASWRQLQKRKISNKPQYSPHRYLGYYPTPNYIKGKNRHNSLGYRGEEIEIPKPPGEFRIVCLGGSTTYTGQVEDYRKSYPYLLEKYLNEKGYRNVTVVNAGAGGWSSWESLINFELRVLDLEPDMIIDYDGINDIYPRFVWPPEAYRGDNSGYTLLDQTAIFMPSILEYSTILRIAMLKMGLITPHAAFERTIKRNAKTYFGSLFHQQKLRGTYPSGIFKEISARQMLETNKPIYFERNIRNMIVIAKSRGIKVVLSSFAYSPLFTDIPEVSSQEFISAIEENNRLLQKIAQEMDVYFFDFAGKFPTDKRWFKDGIHVNEEGAKLKAKLFGDFLINNHLLPSHNSSENTAIRKTSP